MNQIQIQNITFRFWIPLLIFFTGTFIYFGVFGDYVLFYQEKSSLFIFSSDFLIENLHQPGGFIIWLGKLITTFFYYPISGAFIIAAFLTSFVIIVRKTIGFLSGNNALLLPIIFGLAFFFLQTDYRFLVLNLAGVLMQLVLFHMSVKYITMFKGWIPVLLSPFWFFIAGGFSWIFVTLLILYFAFYNVKNGWQKIIAIIVLLLLSIYISKEFLFFQSLKTLLFYPFTELNAGFHPVLFFTMLGIISAIPLLSLIKLKLPVRYRISVLLSTILVTTFVLIVAISVCIAGYNKKDSQYFQVEKLFYQNRFDEVTAFIKANPSNNSLTIFLNNIALCESGKLNDELLSFPQKKDGTTLYLKWEMINEVLKRGGYFYYTIGMVNEAHRWAFEEMVMKGLSPEALKILIKTDLINGNYKVACSYISILKKTAFYRDEARVFEKLLSDENAINSDAELGVKRRNRLRTDFFAITDDPYINIERILSKDSLNRNAFEYKVAFLLLNKDYKGIAAVLPEFGKRGFTKFPVLVNEAILALTLFNNDKLPELGNIPVDKNTELRWTQFLTVFQQYGNDPKAAEPALRKQFGNTFWYWAFYR